MIVKIAILSIFARLAAAHSNGMDMSMDGAMSLTSGSMVPWLHFAIGGDTLWFLGWVPTSPGAMVGACIGLVLLAIFDRWLNACRSLLEAHWRKRAAIAIANKLNSAAASDSPAAHDHDVKLKDEFPLPTVLLQTLSKGNAKGGKSKISSLRTIAPFMPSQDVTRGILHAIQAALGFAFMLAVMTFQVGYFISICVGFGIGEMLFGRFASYAHLHY